MSVRTIIINTRSRWMKSIKRLFNHFFCYVATRFVRVLCKWEFFLNRSIHFDTQKNGSIHMTGTFLIVSVFFCILIRLPSVNLSSSNANWVFSFKIKVFRLEFHKCHVFCEENLKKFEWTTSLLIWQATKCLLIKHSR